MREGETSPAEARISDGDVPRRPGTAADAIDEMVPATVALPSSAADVVSIVDECRRRGRALVAVGGGTLVDIGNRPRRFDLKLDLSALAPTIEPWPDDMVVRVASSVRLDELNARLATVGQRVTLEAPDSRRATVGGLAASDFAGPLSYRFGNPRDIILGLTVVDGRRRLLNVGGRVVKNVAGYDLPLLFVGSYGTLGVLTSLTLRTHPRPESTHRLKVNTEDSAALDALRGALFGSRLPLSSLDMRLEYCGGERRWSLHSLVEGTAAEVAYQQAEIAALARRYGPVVDDVDDDQPREETLVVRFTGRPSSGIRFAAELADAASALGIAGRITAEAGAARLRWRALCDSGDAVRAVALARDVGARHAATSVIERLPTGAKHGIDVWGEATAGIAIMKRLKERFDPDGVLAPGRFVGGL